MAEVMIAMNTRPSGVPNSAEGSERFALKRRQPRWPPEEGRVVGRAGRETHGGRAFSSRLLLRPPRPRFC